MNDYFINNKLSSNNDTDPYHKIIDFTKIHSDRRNQVNNKKIQNISLMHEKNCFNQSKIIDFNNNSETFSSKKIVNNQTLNHINAAKYIEFIQKTARNPQKIEICDLENFKITNQLYFQSSSGTEIFGENNPDLNSKLSFPLRCIPYQIENLTESQIELIKRNVLKSDQHEVMP